MNPEQRRNRERKLEKQSEEQKPGVSVSHVMVKGWGNKAQKGPVLGDNRSVNWHYVGDGVDTVMMVSEMKEPAINWKGHILRERQSKNMLLKTLQHMSGRPPLIVYKNKLRVQRQGKKGFSTLANGDITSSGNQ
ncbi:transport membrane protein [Trifolium repens]|nr:transport membrane protein [Trifolium repens]